MTADVDIVQGYKLGRGDPWYRKVIGRVYHHVVKLLFGLPVRDTDCDFRLIRRELLEQVELTSTSGVICVEMMRKFDRSARASSRSASATTPARTAGRSSSASRPSPARRASCWRCGGGRGQAAGQ